MKTWITSDLHFGHANILKFCPATRGRFHNVDHMNSVMIAEWNQSVQPEDTVYILGDVSFASVAATVAILRSLNGNKILVQGNHDSELVKSKEFVSCFRETHNYLKLVYQKKFTVIMFHFPIYEWDQMHKGSIHFHGHLHGNSNGMPGTRALDIGFDATGKVVSDLDQMIELALRGTNRPGHQKGT